MNRAGPIIRFSLAEILVLAGTASTGGMAPPTSTRISTRINMFGHFTRKYAMMALVLFCEGPLNGPDEVVAVRAVQLARQGAAGAYCMCGKYQRT